MLRNMSAFDGKSIELHSEVKFTMHGMHLLGRQCRELRSLGLSIDEDQYKDKKVADFVRQVMSMHGEASVVLVGHLDLKSADGSVPSESYAGDFILEKVIRVSGP